MNKLLFLFLITLIVFSCESSQKKPIDTIQFSHEDAYAKWVFYSVNFYNTAGVLITTSFDLQIIEDFQILNEDVVSIKYIKEDTLVYHFFIRSFYGEIQPRLNYMPWIIIQNNTKKVLGIMGDLSTLSNYRECVQNFSEINNSIGYKHTPTGQYFPFPLPIENSEREFVDLLENKNNLKELNPWLYYYFNYFHKKQKLDWNAEIIKEISDVIIEDRKRNPIMRVWLK